MTEPDHALVTADACRVAHERLLATVAKIDDEVARQSSRLPGWSVGHVLTHIARHADGHRRRVEGALRGEDLERYPGGMAARDADIEAADLELPPWM